MGNRNFQYPITAMWGNISILNRSTNGFWALLEVSLQEKNEDGTVIEIWTHRSNVVEMEPIGLSPEDLVRFCHEI